MGLLVVVVAAFAACVGEDPGGPPEPPPADGDGGPTDPPGGTPRATLSLAKPSRWVARGGTTNVAFTVERTDAAVPLVVRTSGLPAGVSAAEVSLDATGTKGEIVLSATADAALGVEGTADVVLAAGDATIDTKKLVVRVSGAPGSEDTTWGASGVAALTVQVDGSRRDTNAEAIAVYPATAGVHAGKVLLAGRVAGTTATNGRFYVARLAANGALDTTFGALSAGTRAGYVVVDPGPTYGENGIYVTSLDVDSKQRVIVSSFWANAAAYCRIEVRRLTPEGDLDTSFATFSENQNDPFCGQGISARALPNDDVAVLSYWNYAGGRQTALLQILGAASGTKGPLVPFELDPAAGEKATLPFDFRIDAQGRFVVAGAQCDGGWSSNAYDCRAVVTRLGSNGTIDATFGTAGGYTAFKNGDTNTDKYERFFGLTLDPSGGVVAVGTNQGALVSTVARLGADGLPSAFGTGGVLTRDLAPGALNQYVTTVDVDDDGRLLLVGLAIVQGAPDYYAVRSRLLADGAFDATYADSGVGKRLVLAIPKGALGIDGRLYVATSVPASPSGSNAAVLRYWP